MEVSNKFTCAVVEDKFVVEQRIIKEMTVEESLIEFNKMNVELTQVQKQKQDLEKYIEDKKAEADLEKIKENVDTIEKLNKEWSEKTKPLLDVVKKKFKRSVKQEKIKRGYDREKDTNKKLVLRANILGHISNETNLDVTHPIVAEARKDFDKI